MKKTLLATAILGAMSFTAVAQAADVNYNLYGSLRVNAVSAEDTSLKVGDNSSRIGIKATAPLDNGLTGLAHFEQGVSTETGAWGTGRLAYVGVTGDFGTVTAGQQWTPQYQWTSAKVDILDVGSHPTNKVARASNTLAYISPNLGGLQLAGVVIAAGGASSSAAVGDDADAYNLAANYTAGDFSIGAASLIENNGKDTSTTTVAASYTMDALYVAAIATSVDKPGTTSDDDSAELAASFAVNDKATLLANYVSFEKGSQAAVEAQYKLGAKARVAASAVMADKDSGMADKVAVSFRVDF